MPLNGCAISMNAEVMGLLILPSVLTCTVIVRQSRLQHILIDNEHRFLHCRVPKAVYIHWKRVFKVPSGTLDKVSSKMDHQSDLIFLSTLKPEESVSYRKGKTWHLHNLCACLNAGCPCTASANYVPGHMTLVAYTGIWRVMRATCYGILVHLSVSTSQRDRHWNKRMLWD
ncbi:hypothetical protein DPEC_G00206820 [Dallia pectoralis]|uniref:Uncharacterized protein n=1 Tax=Dallia pectoralis TaxID=75939 RepID=A0ACC2G4S8_DALPE|nr:hypothetical protein DPEC_G00206820 [Dallia pectoralis]